MADVTDRWHKSRRRPGDLECAKHGMVPSTNHGDGMRWQARWQTADGEQRSKNFELKIPAREHQNKMRAMAADEGGPADGRLVVEAAGSRPLPSPAVPKSPPVSEYVETFLARHEGRDGTVDAYGSRLRHHVVPALGERPVGELRRAEIVDFFAGLRRAGVSDGSRGAVRKALSALLTSAVEIDELLDANPVLGLRMAKAKPLQVNLTRVQVEALAAAMNPKLAILVWLGACAGLRLGECSGLRRRDINFGRRTITVEVQRQKGAEVELKTVASHATIPVDQFLLDRITAHLAQWRAPVSEAELRRRARRGAGPLPVNTEELVVVNRLYLPLRRGPATDAVAVAAAKTAVPEGTSHRALRRFYIASLGKSGLDPKEVQRRARHGRFGETWDGYAYAMEGDPIPKGEGPFDQLFGDGHPKSPPEGTTRRP